MGKVGYLLQIDGGYIGNGGATKSHPAFTKRSATKSIPIVAKEFRVKNEDVQLVEIKEGVNYVTRTPLIGDRTRV